MRHGNSVTWVANYLLLPLYWMLVPTNSGSCALHQKSVSRCIPCLTEPCWEGLVGKETDESISETVQSLLFIFSQLQVRQEVNGAPFAAYFLAKLAVLLAGAIPEFKDYLYGRLLKRCPYLIPNYFDFDPVSVPHCIGYTLLTLRLFWLFFFHRAYLLTKSKPFFITKRYSTRRPSNLSYSTPAYKGAMLCFLQRWSRRCPATVIRRTPSTQAWAGLGVPGSWTWLSVKSPPSWYMAFWKSLAIAWYKLTHVNSPRWYDCFMIKCFPRCQSCGRRIMRVP